MRSLSECGQGLDCGFLIPEGEGRGAIGPDDVGEDGHSHFDHVSECHHVVDDEGNEDQ